MDKDVNNFFCSSSGSKDICEKHKFQNQLDVFFCYSLYVCIIKIMEQVGALAHLAYKIDPNRFINLGSFDCYFKSTQLWNKFLKPREVKIQKFL